MSEIESKLGLEAIETKGWLNAYKFLILRRTSQLGILGLFLLGPWFGLWLVKGNLSSSLTLDVIPLTDPYVLLQSIFAGNFPYQDAIIGAAIILGFYILVGGRSYCSWVCPMNIVTDTANWLRQKLKIKGSSINIDKNVRYWILIMSLMVAFFTGKIIWELVNPVSILHRGIIFGMSIGWALILGIFLFELFVSKHGWCGRLCPVGAFYGLLGKISILRVSANAREACDDCMECYIICPEPQVINPALRGNNNHLITDSNCTNCGRCIDICAESVFSYSHILQKVNHSSEIVQQTNHSHLKEAKS